MASPLGDSSGFRPPLAESAASIPSLPVTPGGFPALLDAARQQTELVFWIVRTVQEHEGKLQSLSRQLADQLSVTKLLSEDRKAFRATNSRKWQAGLGNRGLSRESFHSADGFSGSQGASSPTYQDLMDTDKTHIEENVETDLERQHSEKKDDVDDLDVLMPVDPAASLPEEQKEDQAEHGRSASSRQLSEMEVDPDPPNTNPADGDARRSASIGSDPPVRRFSFLEGGRRPSTRSLPLQVDPSFAGNIITEERLAQRLEERLQQALAEDVEHRLEDLAQYIQEEMYHFVLGPDMMERVRQEASNLLQIEMAVALAAQDKKMEDLVMSRIASALGQWSPENSVSSEALMSLHQTSSQLGEFTDGLSRRVKLVEENVSELKGIRLQVPDMRNDITTLQSNLAACVQSIEDLEVQQQELVAAGAKPSRNASPARQLLSPSGSATDDLLAEAPRDPETTPAEVQEHVASPVPSPSQDVIGEDPPEIPKPKRRLSDMLGLYMPPPPKPPAVDDSQVKELVASNDEIKNRLQQMEQLVGSADANMSSRRNSLQNKINDIDTLASILEDRMRELDSEFRVTNQKVQSQLDVLLAAHETQQAEDLKHNKTWNLANQASMRWTTSDRHRLGHWHRSLPAVQPSEFWLQQGKLRAPAPRVLAEPAGCWLPDRWVTKSSRYSYGASRRLSVAGAAAAGVGGLYLVCPPGDRYNIDIKPISDEVFNNHDNLFVFYFEKAEDLNERSEDFHRVISSLVQEPVLKKVTYYQNVRKDGDPALPGGEEREDKPLRVVMYKGQRKSVLLIGDKIPKEEIVDFYKPVSQDLSKIKVPKKVPMVSNSSFHKDVLEASGPRKPMVLLQMFEDTCFLCFLMRPFVNSLAALTATRHHLSLRG
ncbi:unnamed protein product [Durusdinium trenchii]|uniref:Uncharacterized protein n=1 Tax=Durusdinium trenchii TaxID=1381693 RepID=A0ABP0L793_9DINO